MKTFTIKLDNIIFMLKALLMLSIMGLISTQLFANTGKGEKTESPYFTVISEKPGLDRMPLKSTQAKVNITGVIADVIVTQTYKNEGKNTLEAIYTFPASSQAAIYAMEMTIGKRKIVAQIEEKNKARKQYEAAKSEGKRTSLLEQQRPNVFQMNVANILPGDLIQVSLKYTELLSPEAGTYKFVYPTVVGPRYSEKGSGNDQFVNSPYTRSGDTPSYDFDIDVQLSTGMPIQHVASNSHKVKLSYPNASIANIDLDGAETKAGNRDFVLEYKLSGNKVESGLMLYEHGDENFFMLMVQPPKRVIKEEIPPREYIFIVDVSGSMRGFPLNLTKTLMRNLVVNLRPTDKFNVMVFSGSSGWMSDQSLPAIPANINKATHFIDGQYGGGGTRLLNAMQKAMNFPRATDGLSRSFVVVTDGYIRVEKDVFDMIRNESDKANLFAFGIGSSVNRHLIEGMAHVGMSEPLIVMNQDGAEAEAEKFRQYINHPVLTDLKKSFNGFEAYDVEPVSIPDLLAERPLVIYGKYRGKAKGNITIKGKAGSKRYKKTFDVSSVQPQKSHAALRYLWARKRIQMLDDYSSVDHSNANKEAVTQLGLKYNLMTAYTSFLAIEENRVADGQFETVKQALPLPQGVPNSAVGFEMGVESEDFSFSFHKDIRIEHISEKTQQKAAVKAIEGQLLPALNHYLSNNNVQLSNILLTIDQHGNVIHAEVKGPKLTQKAKTEILHLMNKLQLSSKLSARSWKINILF